MLKQHLVYRPISPTLKDYGFMKASKEQVMLPREKSNPIRMRYGGLRKGMLNLVSKL